MSDIQTVRMVRTEDGKTGDIHPHEVVHMEAHGWSVDEGYVPGEPTLRQDGPTVAEFVAAGYLASNYPPEGYASRSTEEEVAEAIAAQAVGSSSAEPGEKIDLGTDSGDQFSDEQLRAAITEATGTKPHNRTGRDKLIAQFNEINAKEAA